MKPSILMIDDNEVEITLLKKALSNSYKVYGATNLAETMSILKTEAISLILLDILMPDMQDFLILNELTRQYPLIPVMIHSQVDKIDSVVEAMKKGAIDYAVKSSNYENLTLKIENLLKVQDLTLKVSRLEDLLKYQETIPFFPPHPIYKKLIDTGLKIAKSVEAGKGLSLLIQGETGVGKEMFANYIYKTIMPGMPFVCVNCGAISPNLAESELFGHEAGAFTDARDIKLGKIELANGGILFLDEIGNMPLDIQIKLLRVLQNKIVVRVGSSVEIPVRFLLISATNENLEQAVAEKRFREDLYYRINDVSINLPVLREIKELIPVFAKHFLELANRQFQKNIQLTPPQLIQLTKREWKGNLRQLQSEIDSLVVLGNESVSFVKEFEQQHESHLPEKFTMAQMEKYYIEKALENTNYVVSSAAKVLGYARSTLKNKIKKYRIRRPA